MIARVTTAPLYVLPHILNMASDHASCFHLHVFHNLRTLLPDHTQLIQEQVVQTTRIHCLWTFGTLLKGGTELDERDRAPLWCPPSVFSLDSAFIKHYEHLLVNDGIRHEVSFEFNTRFRSLLLSGGAQVSGYDIQRPLLPAVLHPTVRLQVGYGSPMVCVTLVCHANRCRMINNPARNCPQHPMDAMFLRNCVIAGVHDDIGGIDSLWDVLAVRMYNTYAYPWIVVSVEQVGNIEPGNSETVFAARSDNNKCEGSDDQRTVTTSATPAAAAAA